MYLFVRVYSNYQYILILDRYFLYVYIRVRTWLGAVGYVCMYIWLVGWLVGSWLMTYKSL